MVRGPKFRTFHKVAHIPAMNQWGANLNLNLLDVHSVTFEAVPDYVVIGKGHLHPTVVFDVDLDPESQSAYGRVCQCSIGATDITSRANVIPRTNRCRVWRFETVIKTKPADLSFGSR